MCQCQTYKDTSHEIRLLKRQNYPHFSVENAKNKNKKSYFLTDRNINMRPNVSLCGDYELYVERCYSHQDLKCFSSQQWEV